MDFLNSIFHMKGFDFLCYYGCYMVIILVITKIVRLIQDSKYLAGYHRIENKSVSKPNPYHIALLREEPRDFIRMILYELYVSHFLYITQEDKVAAVPEEPQTDNAVRKNNAGTDDSLSVDFFDSNVNSIDSSNSANSRNSRSKEYNQLSEEAKACLPWFSQPRDLTEVFTNSPLQQMATQKQEELNIQFREEGLIYSSEHQSNANRIVLLGTALLLLPGIIKLFIAIFSGHSNVIFLLVTMCFGGGIFRMICSQPHLTKKGKQYVKNVQDKYTTPIHQNVNGAYSVYNSLLTYGCLGTAFVLANPAFSTFKSFMQDTHVETDIPDHSGSDGGGSGDGGGCGGCGGCG